jgi:GTPase Era involved in 16S rRNA processing
MILYDTPGVILKKLRKLDDMMMQNVRTATLNADCVLVVVDACHSPEQVNLSYFSMLLMNLACCLAQLKGEQQQSMCVLNKDLKELVKFLYLV